MTVLVQQMVQLLDRIRVFYDDAHDGDSCFEMGNLWYNEPKTLNVAFDVIGDIVLSAASQQYGGFTVPSVDLLLEPYAERKAKQNDDREVYRRLGLDADTVEKRKSHGGYPERF